MQFPGSSRQRLAQTLNAAYVDGLLSERTLSYRLDLLFRSSLIDPAGLVHGGRWMLRDLESTNGTRVNGVPVGRCALRPGDRLTLGYERLVVD